MPTFGQTEADSVLVFYNLQNCENCNMYVPEIFKKQTAKLKVSKYVITTVYMRKKELAQIAKNIGLPETAELRPNDVLLQNALDTYQIPHSKTVPDWSSFAVIYRGSLFEIKILDRQKPTN